MSKPTRARFRELDESECRALLARHHVGRMAYTFRDRVDIAPIHYFFDDGWLYGRTALGRKLEIVKHNRWVAFQVDEVEGPFDWRSVVVKGGVYLLRPDGSEEEILLHARALELLRSVAPAVLTAEDPAPEREILFRIHLDEVSGRSSSTKGL